MSVISGVSVAHDVADVDAIDAAAAADEAGRLATLESREAVSGAFVLQTCNRAEAYVVTDDPETGQDVLREEFPDLPSGTVREFDHERSLRHLMRVACGLESLVLGEDQILGQLRDAHELARERGALNSTLAEAVEKAIHVGERAREETAINDGTVSLGSAAVDLAARDRDLSGRRALVVGAGEMATTAARSFADAGVASVTVANRTVENAEHVAAELDVAADAVGLDEVAAAADGADVVVTATASEQPVVDRSDLAGAGETFVVDLGQPRDVVPEAAELAAVRLRDLDDLESLTERTRQRRREAARSVEDLVDEEFAHLLERYKRMQADDVIAAMYEGAEYVKRREVSEAVRKLEERGELPDEQREVVESMADALVNQLLAAPTRSLRDAAAEDDWTTINTALQLFDPEFGVEVELPEEGREGVPGSADD